MDASLAPRRAALKPRPLARRLLAWWDVHRRDLPWRATPGETPDPYRVWLSEILLQQTTAAAAAPYYPRFLPRWPRVEALAAASLDEVIEAFAGLGYYARARNLHACAQEIARRGGRFPEPKRHCGRCRASAPIPRRRWRRSLSASRRRRSTAMSRASWPGCSRCRRQLPRRAPRSPRRRRRLSPPTGRAISPRR